MLGGLEHYLEPKFAELMPNSSFELNTVFRLPEQLLKERAGANSDRLSETAKNALEGARPPAATGHHSVKSSYKPKTKSQQ
jgi:hypothetical protein